MNNTRRVWFDRPCAQPTPVASQPFVVVNPLARRASSAVAEVVGQCDRLGIPIPRSLATTREQPGSAQARQALDSGADMVIVIGGDGTVRQVARELAGTDTRISIVALGSGNVLAYNLGLANHDLATKISIALTGPSVELDVGWANLQTASGQRFDEPFLTMAGIGRDAQTVARTRLSSKVRIGAAAYALHGVRQAIRPPLPMKVQLDDDQPESVLTWTVLAGLTRQAPGGVVVYPDARPDDGLMDVLQVPIRNPVQWLPVAAKGVLNPDLDVAVLRYQQAERLRVRPFDPLPAQLDGDVVNRVVAMDARIQPRGLRVQVPPECRDGA